MQYLLSPARLESKRRRFEARRAARKEAQVVHFFHQEDEPYSQLLAAVLPQFQARSVLENKAEVGSPGRETFSTNPKPLISSSRAS